MEFTKLSIGVLDIKSGIEALLDGKVVIIKQYERTYKGDVLLRLGENGLTYISYDTSMENLSWSGRMWAVNYVPIAVFTAYTCYVFDKGYNLFNGVLADKLSEEVVVRYTKADGTEDVARVLDVLQETTTLDTYLKLSGEAEPISISRVIGDEK